MASSLNRIHKSPVGEERDGKRETSGRMSGVTRWYQHKVYWQGKRKTGPRSKGGRVKDEKRMEQSRTLVYSPLFSQSQQRARQMIIPYKCFWTCLFENRVQMSYSSRTLEVRRRRSRPQIPKPGAYPQRGLAFDKTCSEWLARRMGRKFTCYSR